MTGWGVGEGQHPTKQSQDETHHRTCHHQLAEVFPISTYTRYHLPTYDTRFISITVVYRFLTCDVYSSTTKPRLTKLARPLSRGCDEPALNVLVPPACPDSPLKKLTVSSKWWEVPPGEMRPVAFRFTIFLRKAWFDSVRFDSIHFC